MKKSSHYENVPEIINRIVTLMGLSHEKEIAELLGISKTNFSNLKKRGTLIPRIMNWAVHENINAHWLLTGEGEMTETIEPYGLPRPKPMPDKALNADSDFFMATIKALTSYADTLPDSELRDKILNFISFLISEHTRTKKQDVEIEKKIAA